MDPQNPIDPIDPASFLLPKKEAPAPAQRINAGALLEQEVQAAKQESPLRRDKHDPNSSVEIPASPTPPPPKAERPEVSPLQTYKSDVERSVEERGVSVVSVAAAEAERRGKQGQTPETVKEARKIFGMNVAMVSAGVVLILLAAGVVAFILLRPTTLPGPQTLTAPFMSVDDTALVVADTSSRDALVTNIAAAVQSAHLSLGLIEWLYIAPPGGGGAVMPEITLQELLGIIAPDLPPELLRTLQPTYLFGVHSFDQNQAFLLLQTDSYETAYSGMLSWERTMRADLNPIFVRNPSPHTTTTNTTAQASSTPQFIQTGFVDKVVENRDTRVILNPQGDILLLWTMLGRNTILITTNEYTLREVVSRMNVAPIVPIPGK